MTHPWLPNDNEAIIKKMNKTIGINNWKELFKAIPHQLFLKEINVGDGKPLTPMEIEKKFSNTINKNSFIKPNNIFAGGPICPHYLHPLAEYLVRRGEFLTAYTPYQPEINQGLLQAIYEYQSLMTVLYGIDVINAGMYDGATALAEAALIALRIKKKKIILAPITLYNSYKKVLETYLSGPEAKIVYYKDEENGELGTDFNEKIKEKKPSAVIIDYPSCRGVIRKNIQEAIDESHINNALTITLSEPTALGILKPPGEMDADIVVGEGQSLGLPMYHGGSLLGILGVRWERSLVRNMPGRLIGKTVDTDGKESYMMILQTREQHIRREKATSNITTNTTLNAITVAVNLALYGEKGFRSLSEKILENTFYFREKIRNKVDKIDYSKGIHFGRISYKLNQPEKLLKKIIKEKNILPYSLILGDKAFSCITEIHDKKDIDELVKTIGGE